MHADVDLHALCCPPASWRMPLSRLTCNITTPTTHSPRVGTRLAVACAASEINWHLLLSLPAFLVTDHERMYTLTFWAKANANPHPRPQVTFQDEDDGYAYVDSAYVQLTSFWHQVL